MKKIFLCLLLLFLTGCTTNKKLIVQTRNDVIEIVERFGEVKDEDLNYDPEAFGGFYGTGHVCFYAEDDVIGLNIFEDDVAFMLTFSLEEAPRNYLKIWCVDITYIDVKERISVNLSYYYYNERWTKFKEDYESERYNINFVDFTKGLSKLTIKDARHILIELGYKEVAK